MINQPIQKLLALGGIALLSGCQNDTMGKGSYIIPYSSEHILDREWFQQNVSEYERCVSGTLGGVGGKYEKAPDCWVFVLNKARKAKETQRLGGESSGVSSGGGAGSGGVGCNSFAANESSTAGGGNASASQGSEASVSGGGEASASSGGETSSAGGGNSAASC